MKKAGFDHLLLFHFNSAERAMQLLRSELRLTNPGVIVSVPEIPPLRAGRRKRDKGQQSGRPGQ